MKIPQRTVGHRKYIQGDLFPACFCTSLEMLLTFKVSNGLTLSCYTDFLNIATPRRALRSMFDTTPSSSDSDKTPVQIIEFDQF